MDGVGAEGSQNPEIEVAGKHKTSKPRRSSALCFIERTILRIQRKLDTDEVKGSMTDYLKLLQIRDDMTKEEPKEIKVTWVEPTEKEPATEI